MKDKYDIVIYSLDKKNDCTFLYGYCIKNGFLYDENNNNSCQILLKNIQGFSLVKNEFFVNEDIFNNFYIDLNNGIYNIKHLIPKLEKETNINIKIKRSIIQPFKYINIIDNDNEDKNIIKNEIFYIVDFIKDFLDKKIRDKNKKIIY